MSERVLNVAAANSRRVPHNHERSLAAVINEIRDEVKSFVTTRIEMMKAELHETMKAVKVALPLAVLAIALLSVAGLLFTAAVVVLIAHAFMGNPYAWLLAFVIVGAVWTIFAGVAGFFAYSQLRSGFPKRTVEVLKADKTWLQNEARMSA